MSGIVWLDRLLTADHRQLRRYIGTRPVLDIGAADGDIAFFFASLGMPVHIIDHADTNINHLKGARLLQERLRLSVEIYDFDLDSLSALPTGSADLAFFLGTLYHLKNPFGVLEKLASEVSYCFLSTRVTQHAADAKTKISDIPVAYLLAPYECNNDPTNYWILTEIGLGRILSRTGWEILDYMTVGNTVHSDPVSSKGDQRVFAFLKSSARQE